MSTETKVLGGIGLLTIIIVIVGAFFIGGKNTPDKPTPPADEKILIKSDSHKISSSSATVTLVEFGDFQCPACGSSHPVVKRLIEEYQGKINFVFRNYPLPMHNHAMSAANAAEAAGAQDKFFEMHDLLFENQPEWSESKNPQSHFEEYANELGLNIEQFNEDLKTKKYEKKIKADVADGNSVGVNSTPTFFINGIKQAGGLPYDQFKAKIDSELSK